MSMRRKEISFFLDAACKRPFPTQDVDGKETVLLDFGNVDEGQTVKRDFYIRNNTMGALEDLEVNIVDPQIPNIKFQLASPGKTRALASLEAYHGIVQVTAEQGVKAGPKQIGFAVSGYITTEPE